jgi:hypothetical protein
MVIIQKEHKFYNFRTPRWFITNEVPGEWLWRPRFGLVCLGNLPGEVGYIYGYYIYASEGNEFMLEWPTVTGESRSIRILLPGPGTVMYANTTPINLDSPYVAGSGDVRYLVLYVLNKPSSGTLYQAGILASGCVWL